MRCGTCCNTRVVIQRIQLLRLNPIGQIPRIPKNPLVQIPESPLPDSFALDCGYAPANLTQLTMPDAAESDAQLIELLFAVGQRDAAALRALYDRTAPRLFGLALKLVRQRELAQDVLQEAFLTIWRVANEYRGSLSPPMAWLGLIVRSRALDALRRRKAAREDISDSLDAMDDGQSPIDHLASPEPDPLEHTQASQTARALHGCLSRLEPPQREVLTLAYLNELSHSELAERLKLPLGTVKTWIRRSLEQLRGCMGRFA